MNKTTDTIVELLPAWCVAHPLNRKPRPGHVKELAASIQACGQITEILIRPHPSREGNFEIAAGACRALACEQLGIPVRAVVKPMTDSEIEEILIVENLQREDLDPFEESEKLAMLVENGHDVAKFAAGLGKSTSWLKSRMRLTNLDKTVGKGVKGKWPLEFIEALSDYPPITQKIILDQFRWNAPKSVKDIRHAGKINSIRVDNVEWLSDDRTANGKCGANGCSTTDHDMLFHEKGKCINCMNPDCFKKRHAKHLSILVEELIAIYPGRVLLREDIYRLIDNQLGSVHKGVKKVERWIMRKEFGDVVKTPDDTSYAVVEMNEENHSVVWHFHKKEETQHDKDGKAPASPLDASKDNRPDKVAMLKGKRFMALHTLVVEKLEDFSFPVESVTALLAAFGTCHNYKRGDSGDRWKMFDARKFTHSSYSGPDERMKNLEVINYLIEQTRLQMLERLITRDNPSRAAEDKNLCKEVECVADFIGVNIPEATIKIAVDLPPAKSWADEVDPITLKPKKTKDITAKTPKPIKGLKPKKSKPESESNEEE